MSIILRKVGIINPALLGLVLLLPNSAIAAESVEMAGEVVPEISASETLKTEASENTQPLVLADADVQTTSVSDLMTETKNDDLAQVTSVSQLSDVQPDDWAFQAIQSLVERYGCVAGYPNGTFRPDRAMSRREAAALVNACLDNLSNRFATKEDLDALKALQDEFAAELATLRGRVDGLEARVATVEAQQFSTTTKLKGEAVFGLGYAIDDSAIADPAGDEQDRVFLGGRARLNFDTSFTGSDTLHLRLQARNIPTTEDATGTRMSRIGFAGDNDNQFELSELSYKFKPTENVNVKIDAVKGEFKDNFDLVNPYLKSSGSGAVGRFARHNPIYRQGGNGVGATVDFDVSEQVNIAVGYLADEGESASGAGDDIADPRGGLIEGSYAAMAQVTVEPFEKAKFALTYARAFDEAGNVNVTSSYTTNNRRPFGNAVDTTADHFGFSASVQPADWVNFSGWLGYTKARTSNAANDDSADYLNWMGSLQFPDLGMEGSLGYVSFGQPYKIINTGGGFVNPDDFNDDGTARPGTSYHLEAGYKFKVNDNISITPGVIWILNPENNSANNDVIVPVLRTTFKF